MNVRSLFPMHPHLLSRVLVRQTRDPEATVVQYIAFSLVWLNDGDVIIDTGGEGLMVCQISMCPLEVFLANSKWYFRSGIKAGGPPSVQTAMVVSAAALWIISYDMPSSVQPSLLSVRYYI